MATRASGKEMLVMITCKAPVNIAVVKYWGKRNEEIILPLNDSISITLDLSQMFARTTVAVSKNFPCDKIWLNGIETSVENPRVQNCLKEVRRHIKKRSANKDELSISAADGDLLDKDAINWHIHICSENNFPTAAGLASSAAGYACLAYSLAKLYNVELDLSEIARKGSGSACRSIYGGFVRWAKGEKDDGTDSVAHPIAPASHWPEMRLMIMVVSGRMKTVSSTVGMQRSVATSSLIKHRVESVVAQRAAVMAEAIMNRDFQTFSTIMMQESNQLHAICLDTWPPITYLTDTSRRIMTLVHNLNVFSGRNKVAYTFDAGPNAFLFMLESDVPLVTAVIKHYFPSDTDNLFRGLSMNETLVVLEPELKDAMNVEILRNTVKFIINTKVGDGPQIITDAEEHMLDEYGLPKILVS